MVLPNMLLPNKAISSRNIANVLATPLEYALHADAVRCNLPGYCPAPLCDSHAPHARTASVPPHTPRSSPPTHAPLTLRTHAPCRSHHTRPAPPPTCPFSFPRTHHQPDP
jgi:hypothetical protein